MANENRLVLISGDSYTVKVKIDNYTPGGEDVIHTQCKTEDGSEVLWDCYVPIDTMEFKIKPEYTRGRDLRKKYFYDVQLEFPNGDVKTFITKTQVKLEPEVTLKKVD